MKINIGDYVRGVIGNHPDIDEVQAGVVKSMDDKWVYLDTGYCILKSRAMVRLEPEKAGAERTAFDGGGVRDGSVKTERFELAWTGDQPYGSQMLVRYARWMARGAEKYADRNWESFASPDALEHAKGSLLRHVFKLLAGLDDEDHAAAVWFNVQAIELIRERTSQ